ncbi:hypothetical protein KY49_3557 [Burkholderia sp. MSHR3999]|nr:hypothetical protein KY49_3557 [Burkholderia sp. MSHR3999]
MATEVWIVTDHQHPVLGTEGARVIELDAPAKIEAMLSTDLSAHSTQAAAAVQQRLQADHGALAHQLVSIYQSVADAWGIGITTIPAVVVDRRYVVYGDPDASHALARIHAYREAHP